MARVFKSADSVFCISPKFWRCQWQMGEKGVEMDQKKRDKRSLGAQIPSVPSPSGPTGFDQKMSFNANCNCRDEPESLVGNRVLVIRPKFRLPTTAPGWPKLAWLNRSKNSARNSVRNFSVMAVFLSTEKSTFRKPGPITTLRPRLPK